MNRAYPGEESRVRGAKFAGAADPMADVMSPEKRSALMSGIRSRDTGPEKILRRMLHKAGFRYRLHAKDLPGCPDIVFYGRRKVVFVHGCFWHLHPGCRKVPASRQDFWISKLVENCKRDRSNRLRLKRAGWDVLVVWECELRDPEAAFGKVRDFLDGKPTRSRRSGQAAAGRSGKPRSKPRASG